jgi:hypothetical protein
MWEQGTSSEILNTTYQKGALKDKKNYSINIVYRGAHSLCRSWYKRVLTSNVADPDPDQSDAYVFGLLDPDPDPLARGMEPDLDPSIIMQK